MAKRSYFDDLTPHERELLGARVRRVVETIGTQAHASKVARISLGQLKAYMRGQCVPSLMPLLRLARASGFNLDWIVSGQGDEKSNDLVLPSFGSQAGIYEEVNTLRAENKALRELVSTYQKLLELGHG